MTFYERPPNPIFKYAYKIKREQKLRRLDSLLEGYGFFGVWCQPAKLYYYYYDSLRKGKFEGGLFYLLLYVLAYASNSVPTTRSTTSKATSEADEKKKNKVVKSLEDNLSIIQRLERRP